MAANKPQVPKDLAARVGAARTIEDWQRIANELSPVIQGIADGTVKSTAAQTAILKDIMNRAYGRPTAAAIEKRESAGIIVLPVLETGDKAMLCPKCGYDIAKAGDGLHERVLIAVAKAAHATEDTLGS